MRDGCLTLRNVEVPKVLFVDFEKNKIYDKSIFLCIVVKENNNTYKLGGRENVAVEIA